MRNPGKYKSVSAFAPIANPSECPWGQKAFKGYFGEESRGKWKEHDATELVKKYQGPLNLLIDVVCLFNLSFKAMGLRPFSLILKRVLVTIFTKTGSCCLRTSPQLLKRRGMTRT